MELNIRKANVADRDLIAEFNQKMAMETENRRLDPEIIGAGVEAVLKDESKGFYIVAEAGNVPVACLMITFEWSDWRNGPMWWFQSVFVDESMRGKQIFSKMYHFIKEMARKEGVKELRLYVEKENTHAQKVYEKLGMSESHYYMYEVEI